MEPTMIDLRDPLWQFIITVSLTVLAILATVVVTVVVYLRQRQRKALEYQVVAVSPLVSVADEVKGKLQILFEGSPIQNAHLIVVKFVNTGNTPITESDFIAPLSLVFWEDHLETSYIGETQVNRYLIGKTKVLSTEVIETKPPNSQVSITAKDATVLIRPSLLNPQDSITIKVLVTEFEAMINVNARIIGVKQLTRYDLDQSKQRHYYQFLIQLVILFFLGIFFLALGLDSRDLSITSALRDSALAVLAGVGSAYITYPIIRAVSSLIHGLMRKKT
jgi:hypothetical protein